MSETHTKTRATQLAETDADCFRNSAGRWFSQGTRPVIRWIKGDGLDDMVTKAAIGQATRIFGNEVDYCLCTQGIDAARARKILEWAVQPVEWWPVTEKDNQQLAGFLSEAGCPAENFGYWWKWFPERVRPEAPEWILDGDMVITGKPVWYTDWLSGKDRVRLTQDDAETPLIYGNYAPLADLRLKLYSGLASLPPGCRYMPFLEEILRLQPLAHGHNGKKDMDEQGVIAATFQKLGALPIPLYEFPFCRAFQNYVDFGLQGDRGKVWGYHFGNSFIMHNPHFDRLTAEKTVFSIADTSLLDKFVWLNNAGQWGIPGWSLGQGFAQVVSSEIASFKGKFILEAGTSRGYISAILANSGNFITTTDHLDRGAGRNLEGLPVKVVVDDFVHFLNSTSQHFDLIVIDVHGNSPDDWKKYAKSLIKRVKQGSTLMLNNARLGQIPEWHEETGVEWFLDQLPQNFHVQIFDQVIPGVAVVKNKKNQPSENKILSNLSHPLSLFRNLRHLRGASTLSGLSRMAFQMTLLTSSELFDEAFYLENNPEIRLSGMKPALHFLLYGGIEGRKPSVWFDSAAYLSSNPDVAENGMNPLIHYLKYGKKEGRSAF